MRIQFGSLLPNLILICSAISKRENQERIQRKIQKFDIMDNNLDLEELDMKEKAFNYTKTAFSPNKYSKKLCN